MNDTLALRRHLYETLARKRRGRKALRRQVQLLSAMGPAAGPDDGAAGVREPRRPAPPAGPTARALEL